MKFYTKDELIEVIREVSAKGWHRSVKNTIDTRNDGAVGNTLEVLLGLEENNLPIDPIRPGPGRATRAREGEGEGFERASGKRCKASTISKIGRLYARACVRVMSVRLVWSMG